MLFLSGLAVVRRDKGRVVFVSTPGRTARVNRRTSRAAAAAARGER